MNIKSVMSDNPLVIEKQPQVEVSKAVRSESSHKDRDGNGRREPDEQQTPQRHLSEEEMQEAIDHLLSLPGVKSSELNIQWETINGLKVALVKDSQGIVVRRMTELELSTLNKDKDKRTGQLFDKAG